MGTNVKPGYLAYVVGPATKQHYLVGAVVQVLRPCHHGDLFTSINGVQVRIDMSRCMDQVLWICRSRTPLRWDSVTGIIEWHHEIAFRDTHLRPIWGPGRAIEDSASIPTGVRQGQL